MTLTLGIRYLRGQAVATDPTNREQAEWPPHPARVFMALAAAHFESGEDASERVALEWLEALSPPALFVPEVFARSPVTAYVPVNDKAGPSTASLQSAPSFTRSRQPRQFPSHWLGDQCLFCTWPSAVGSEVHLAALNQLCAKVTYLGHSSSLVQVWVADPAAATPANWVPTTTEAELRLRQVSPGTLDYLRRQYNEDGRVQHAAMQARIEQLQIERKQARGPGARQRKDEIQQELDRLAAKQASLDPRPPLRPTISLAQGYRRADAIAPRPVPASVFDHHLLVLSKLDGPSLGLESTLQLTQALRGAVMWHCDLQPPPEWLTGHAAAGTVSETPHLALVPLPFVGHEHADGHVLGLALIFPRAVPEEERGRRLARLLADENGLPLEITLRLGRLGTWTLVREDRAHLPSALRPSSWSEPAEIWASVSPIVLDRFPKSDRLADRAGWNAEVAATIAAACLNIGLPEPVEIDIDKTSWLLGAPRARPDHGGYPLMSAAGKPPRYQVHAWLRFPEPVRGPVLLGAGRYQGYGLCKPWVPPNGGRP